jgi:hypothetical protein
LSMIHLGCQEKIYHQSTSHSLFLLKHLCVRPTWIRITRYFGTGTFHTTIAFFIFFVWWIKKYSS